MQLKGNLFLLGASFIWGTAFVAQLVGMDNLGPFTYCSGRYILGFFSVFLIWVLLSSTRKSNKTEKKYIAGWKYGLGAGIIMFFATSFQQMALQYISAGKTAFITCLYIILVPIFSALLHKKIARENWLGASVAVLGLYFLCVREELALDYGEILALINALFWTFHILYIDRYAAKVDNIELSCAQLGVVAILSTIVALLFEDFSIPVMLHDWFPIFYTGVMSSGVAFTFQIVGQRYAEPAHAAIIMSLESVFGALAGWVILGEQMTGLELFGCALMMAAMVITQSRIILKKK